MAGRLFTNKTTEQQADTLAAFMPGGRPFFAGRMEGTKLRSLFLGLAVETARVEGLLNEITYEHQIDQTTLLIEEWEAALGIPDSCFGIDVPLEQRRKQVIYKLGAGIQTEADFVEFASYLGYDIEVTPGRDIGFFPFTLKFPIQFYDYPQTARFYMHVTIYSDEFPNVFPLEYPIVFGPGLETAIVCLLHHIIPVNVSLTYEFSLVNQGALITESGRYYFTPEDGAGFIVTEM